MLGVSEELKLDLSTLAKHFSDEGEAYNLVERIRWPHRPSPPRLRARSPHWDA